MEEKKNIFTKKCTEIQNTIKDKRFRRIVAQRPKPYFNNELKSLTKRQRQLQQQRDINPALG